MRFRRDIDVFRRSYAAQPGVSVAAVCEAIATGRITTLPVGTIGPVRADSKWCAQTDLVQQGAQLPRSRQWLIRRAMRARDGAEATEREVSFLRAGMANKVLKAQTAIERLQIYRKPIAIRSGTMTRAR